MATVEEISKKIAEDYKDSDKKARDLIQVMICGSYKTEEEINIPEKFRNILRKRGVLAFLMKDIKLTDDDGQEITIPFHLKMHHIWNIMKKGNNIPAFILYAGKTASESQGLNAEIQTIAHDKQKIECAYLFKVNGIQLVSHQECFANIRTVRDGDHFIIEAEKVIDAIIHQSKQFYSAEQEK